MCVRSGGGGGGGLGQRRRGCGSCDTRLTRAACHSLERSMESICGGGCVPRVSGTRRGGGNQGTARFAHFAHFFQRKGVERGLTFFSLFFVEEKKSPTPPLGVCPSQRRANPAKATLQKTGKILKFSILSFGCRRGTGTPPPARAGHRQGRRGTSVILSQATTRRPSTCGCSLRAPPSLSAKATSACFCRRRRRRGDGIAGSRSARSTSARVRVRAAGLVLGLGSVLGLGLELGLG